jgi:ferredoxin-type protein NapH
VLLVLFLPALIVGRPTSCHTLFWMTPFMIVGRWIRNQFAWASLRLAARNDRCTSCAACTKACPMSIDVAGYVQGGSLECPDCMPCGSYIDVKPQMA